MAKKTEKNERSRFGKVCSILTDILVFPVVIIAFACAIFMSSAKANNKVPSIFGNSIVEVLTNSMDLGTEQSYKVGDVLIINQNINLDQIEVGDCLAFYAPKQSGYVDNEGNSLIIFHRVVRIVYVKNNDVNKRYFVCHGDNAGALSYVPAQNIEESTHNAEGNVEPGGGYVVKLVDDTDPATNQDHTLPGSQAQLQYVSDEFVVGKLKSRASGLITGLVKFCTSTAGITAMVIIPSAIMIALVVVNMVSESKAAKKEKEDDTLVFAQSMAGSEGANINIENTNQDKKEITALEAQETKADVPSKEAKAEDIKQTPVKPEPKKAAPTKQTPSQDSSVKVTPKAPSKATTKTDEKSVPATKAAPAKAPAVKSTTPKPVQSKPVAEPKSAPAAPKATPLKAAPKPASAPKAPAAPISAPAKAPAAPKAVPTKAPPKKG